MFAVTKRHRPSRPSLESRKIQGDLDPKVWNVIKGCLKQEPWERPTAGQILNWLHDQRELPTDGGEPIYIFEDDYLGWEPLEWDDGETPAKPAWRTAWPGDEGETPAWHTVTKRKQKKPDLSVSTSWEIWQRMLFYTWTNRSCAHNLFSQLIPSCPLLLNLHF
jgi:hypothetical protein